jgi:lipopolysaccharide export system protein LptA
LTWDESEGEWRVNGVNLNLSGNSLTDVGSLDGGGSAVNVNDVLQLNSNSVNGLNNLGFNGGPTYIIQNSDGDNVFLQADDSSGNRNNFIVVDPDNQVTSFPTGNVQVSNGNLNLNSNSLTNFFGSACSSGQVAAHVNDDGTLDCVDAAQQVQDTYVSRAGDSMTGDLDLQNNDILSTGLVDGVNVGSTGNAITTDGSNRYAVSSNSIALSELDEGSVDSRYVQLSGDRMEGSLDMDGYNINNFFGSACSAGNVVAHVNDDGTLDCVNAADEVQDTYVNRNGDSMTGDLDMSGNNVNNVNTINNGGTTLNVGSTVQASGDLQTGSGTVTSSSEMCIGNQC